MPVDTESTQGSDDQPPKPARSPLPHAESRLPIVLGTLIAMVAVAAVWLGLGYVWSTVIAGDSSTANRGQWPLILQGVSTRVSFAVMVRRRVQSLPRRIQRFDLSGVVVLIFGLLMLLLESLTGPYEP